MRRKKRKRMRKRRKKMRRKRKKRRKIHYNKNFSLLWHANMNMNYLSPIALHIWGLLANGIFGND